MRTGSLPFKYKDLNSLFGKEGEPNLVYGHEAVRQGIYNIFTTTPGEAGPIFEPEFGSMLMFLLQEPLDEKTAFQLRGATIQALQRWEPRIQLSLSETYIEVDTRIPGYRVFITYTLIENGDSGSLSFNLVPLRPS
jgi:phage baseplate assembly protein W